jgi:hypothetical protein
MCQCHDLYEPVPYRLAKPRTEVVTQCHDSYKDIDLERRDQERHPEVEVFAGREPVPV